MSDSEDEESERRRCWLTFQLHRQALVFSCAAMQPAAQKVVGAAAPAGAAAAQVVVGAAAPAAPAAAQVVVGAAAPAGPAAAQVVVRKRPSSEVDIADALGPERRRLRLTAAIQGSVQGFDAAWRLGGMPEAWVQAPAQAPAQAWDLFDPLAFEKEQLALEQAKLALEKEKLAHKAEEFALRKKQDEWEIEKKDRMQRNDRWHQRLSK
jgi:hypothetical protein